MRFVVRLLEGSGRDLVARCGHSQDRDQAAGFAHEAPFAPLRRLIASHSQDRNVSEGKML